MSDTKKTLQVFRSLGTVMSVGWERDDMPMIHVFAQAEPGTHFAVSSSHWPCDVCKAHNYTEQDFHAQIQDALRKGPVS